MNKTYYKICILFDETDIYKFIRKFSDNNFLIFVGLTNNCEYDVVNIWNTEVDEKTISEEVKKLFNNLSFKYGIEIKGYANNFFQSTIIILIKYVVTINKLLKQYQNSEIIFPNKVFLSTGEPNYYLGEYESQGKKFYSRENVFFKSLYRYYKNQGMKISFLNNKISFQYLLNSLRIYAVFAYRFIKDIKNNSKSINLEDSKENTLTYIVRSYAQAQYLKKILKNNGFNNEIIVMYNFIEINNFTLINKLYFDLDNVVVKTFNRYSIKKILKTYLKNLVNILAIQKEQITIEGLEINITQSIKEVLVMYSELLLYKNKLNEGFSKLTTKKINILFSLEQKSPHAYIDGLIAKELNIFFVQLMQCDQDNMKIPYPVVGDLFIPISKEKSKIFTNVWEKERDKIFFPGRLNIFSHSNETKCEYKICYFASFNNDEQYNVNTVETLIKISRKMKFKFIIKLHPRDNGKWLFRFTKEERLLIYKDSEITKEKLYNLFEIAIGSFSAVFIDLLEYKKKYIILNLGNFSLDLKNINYIDSEYKAIVENLEELEYWIENELLLNNEFELFCKRYSKKAGDLCTSKEYMQKIIKRLGK